MIAMANILDNLSTDNIVNPILLGITIVMTVNYKKADYFLFAGVFILLAIFTRMVFFQIK